MNGVRAALRFTGVPPWLLDKRPKLPSRNWLIFLSFTSSCVGLYAYDRRQCRAIRQEYIDKVKDFAEERVDSMYRPRRVTVYGGRWPGDEDYDQSLKYFRKYVKARPILVAAAVDFTMVGGKRLGDVAERVADFIKAQRRREAGLDIVPEVYRSLPMYVPPDKEQEYYLEGGIIIIGRPTFKEFMEGLKRGWTEPLDKVDREELLAQELEADGRFDDVEEGDLPSQQQPSPLAPMAYPTSSAPLPIIPPLPPIALVPFTNLLGFTKIPLMIWDWFNRRHHVRNGAEAAYRVIVGQTRPFVGPADDSVETDLDFDVACERWLKKSLFDIPKDTDKAREKFYTELKTKLETARALARGTREPTKDEVHNPPPTEVELRTERLDKEKRWRGDLAGWQIIHPDTRTAWDGRFRDVLRVYTDPKK
ncbi:hypothetical protein HMN09_00017900 [Mycena chlorophos]|uniref:Mitochondrial import inner membrane translocase subunit TIM54 n=1 Tax=Mycena chlorophos TaxID=658473 RepID=A0A8H6TNP8_MYCCL|nr:hypothetical protein HMN09_00017900 [Mycena chlorophos]